MKEENYIVFDQYLQNEMTLTEKIAFEKQLSEEPEVAADFQNFKEVQAQLENKFTVDAERNAFKENVKSIAGTHFKPNKKVIKLKPWLYLVAASVVLLLGMFVFNANSNPNFEDYNHFETAHFVERGHETTSLKQAEEAYNAKDYLRAIPIFESILKQNKTAEIQYFYGISLLQTNKIQEAEGVFNELKLGSSVFKNKALWGLALIQLKQKEFKVCKEILLTIPSDDDNYEQVQDLLNKLD